VWNISFAAIASAVITKIAAANEIEMIVTGDIVVEILRATASRGVSEGSFALAYPLSPSDFDSCGVSL